MPHTSSLMALLLLVFVQEGFGTCLHRDDDHPISRSMFDRDRSSWIVMDPLAGFCLQEAAEVYYLAPSGIPGLSPRRFVLVLPCVIMKISRALAFFILLLTIEATVTSIPGINQENGSHTRLSGGPQELHASAESSLAGTSQTQAELDNILAPQDILQTHTFFCMTHHEDVTRPAMSLHTEAAAPIRKSSTRPPVAS
ncbi:hypothetical protein BV20DRAFT_314999 [Pilatotrama ljubarskyi]|nr:hypothetical protein BV20DRAFT_314999 [Pilatotrama ljubarskyi]